MKLCPTNIMHDVSLLILQHIQKYRKFSRQTSHEASLLYLSHTLL
jgi:hypothetical protein